MKTAEQTIFIWTPTITDEIIEKIKRGINDFKAIGLEIDEIILRFQDKEDGDKKTMPIEEKEKT